MKVLVIGGTGNIGTAVVKTLLEKGVDLAICGRKTRIPGCRFIQADRMQHSRFEKIMEAQGEWDCVIDMIGYTPEDAESAIRAFSGRTEQFVFCSTVDTFKKPAPSYPIRQDTPRGADKRFTYAWNKVKMEERFEEAAAEGAFALTIVRPAATYNDESMPIGILDSGVAIMRRMRQGLPVIVMGDGLSLWCSAHRDDVGRAIAMAAGNSRAFGKAYTLSGDEAITWIQYYGAVAEALGVPTVEFVGVPTALLAAAAPRECEWCYVNFKYDNVFDNGLAKRDLGFRYTIPWSEGARRMVNHHDSLGAIDGSKDHPNYDRIIESIRRLETEFRKYPYLSAMEDLT